MSSRLKSTSLELEKAQKNLAETQRSLALSQVALADAQTAKLKQPFWRDGIEIVKVSGAIAGLTAILLGAYFQLKYSVLTLKKENLEFQIEIGNKRLTYANSLSSYLKTIPNDIIETPDNKVVDEKWRRETKSDAYILMAMFETGCGNFSSARANIAEARKYDTDKTDFEDILAAIGSYERDYKTEAAASKEMPSCQQSDPIPPSPMEMEEEQAE